MALLFVLLATLTLGPAANGHSYSVKPQTTIAVVLPSNASTGFQWRLAARPDKQVVRLLSHRYVAPKTKRVGAAGKEVWRFRALGAGAARLRLVYVQSGHTTPARRFTVRVRVR
ncbi:MAG TPA: protease inhibitor I42 family protein [Gaiellaceae bacterium]|nr:protease inhibitor I42 family protein [Gaiellaceae bacterium]